MKIGVPKERQPDELRVAVSPDSVKKLVGLGFSVTIESGAGNGASFTDDVFRAAGAAIADGEKAALADADVILKVRAPLAAANGENEIQHLRKGAIVIAQMAALSNKETMKALADAGVTAFAMELLPRITRAQSMDVLSSQSNLAGYKAVLDAAAEFGRAFPMMMTAAGTIAPAKVFIMGAGVAGLQAIATAKRLGAVVSAYDVRPVVKEQVESLGGKFVQVDAEATANAETAGGYAREMSEDYQRKQAEVIRLHLTKQDIAICTALIPGRKAPILITEEMVKGMPEGSVIVDLAVEAGGNCELSEFGKIVRKHGVTIIGHANVPSRLAQDASTLFAKNLLNFITPQVKKDTKELAINWDDEIIKGTLICKDGKLVHPQLQ
jgi:H+-translocating NAD(P) transhydrogenase subunit alpha